MKCKQTASLVGLWCSLAALLLAGLCQASGSAPPANRVRYGQTTESTGDKQPLADLLELTHQASARGAEGEQDNYSEESIGFDQHKDIFYYQDNKANELYGRSKYQPAKVTLGGQRADLTRRQVQKSLNPFAIGQLSLHSMGTSSNRWDVKEDGQRAQLFGLYLGRGTNFVVNKLRAHLLRKLIDAMRNYYPLLDKCAELSAGGEHQAAVDNVYDQIRQTIERTLMEVDEQIRRDQGQVDSAASATVAIVTDSHVIVANVGNGRVFAFDSHFETHNLTPALDSAHLHNIFGATKNRRPGDKLQPHVDIYPRVVRESSLGDEQPVPPPTFGEDEDEFGSLNNDYNYDDDDDATPRELQFLLIETPTVASTISGRASVEVARQQFIAHKGEPQHEQQLYSNAVQQILAMAQSKVSFVDKFFKKPDHLVALVGLVRDYDNIH